MDISIVYIPTPDAEVADRLAKLLLDAKLIACANIFASKSMYMWDGAMHQEDELILICKTIPNLVNQIQSFVKEHHPYELPAIISWSASCNVAYYEWVKGLVFSSID